MDPATLENLIIKQIRKAREISRKDLADQLGIAKSTAGRRVDCMIERGLIREIGIENRREVGRPKRFLALRGEFGSFIGFDFDARHLFAVLVDFAQATVDRKKVRLSGSPDRDEVISRLREIIAEYCRYEAKLPVLGVGIGVPGHIHREARIGFEYLFIANWTNVDLLEELDLTSEFLHIENNTRAIALGEYWLGPHAAAKDLVCINVRTGISAAVIANGGLLTGSHGLAGAIRGWPVSTGVPEIAGSGCLEDLASVRAVTSGGANDEGSWSGFVADCLDAVPEALASLTTIANYHGDAAARMAQLLDPEVIFFSGPFNELGDLYLDRVREATAWALRSHSVSPPPIKPASLGEFAGAYGAASLAAAGTNEP